MIEKLQFELGQLLLDRAEAARAKDWQRVRQLDQQADVKRTELARANLQVNVLIDALWPGARVR